MSTKLDYDASPTFNGLTLRGLTASTLIGANADKLIESVTVGTGLDYTRPTLSLSHLGIEDLTDPGADRIFFWDNSASASEWLAVGNSIAITTTTIDTIQDIRTSASPYFTGIELGHASDTTITRVSAGVIAVEGVTVAMVGGAPTAHTHDGDTLQLDGVNSDGGAFSFTTSDTVTFNQSIASTSINLTTNASLITVDGGVFLANDGTENLFIGEGARHGAIQQYNVFIGYHAGYNNAIGSGESLGNRNVYIGSRAGAGETGGSGNTGSENVAIGYNTLRMNTSGYENIAVGDDALQYNTTGHGNVALGNDAMEGTSGTPITGNYNTALGVDALAAITSGDNNAAIGYQSLIASTTGHDNVAVGYQALYSCTEGYNNLAVGYKALYSLTTGYYNVGFGTNAGISITEGYNNFFIGTSAGYNTTTGFSNVGIGPNALEFNVSGNYNLGLGYFAGAGITGSNNTFIGASGGRNATSINECVGIGVNAGRNLSTGDYNVYIGVNSAYYNQTGSDNCIIGHTSAFGVSGNSFSYNTLLGNESAYSLTTGSYNLIAGFQSGYLLTSGASNVFLGFRAGYRQTNLSDRLIIDNQLRASAAVEITNSIMYGAMAAAPADQSLRINADVGINTTPTLPLDVKAKSGHTSIGGFAIKLTNKTGGNTVAGQLVIASIPVGADTDDAFETAGADAENVIGVVLDAGVADGSEAWIVVSGIADVLMDGGGSARGDRIIASGTAGSADVWNTGGAVATHFREIGHCIETRTGAGLARCVLHFN